MKGSAMKVHIIKKETIQYALDNTIYESVEKYMPKLKHTFISFEMQHTSRQFANAIRRCLTNELELKYLTVDMEDIDIPHGTSIVKDIIVQRIESIPLIQSIPETEIFKLNISNNTDSVIDVYTGSIKPNRNKKELFFNDMFSICPLNPNEYICIDNICVKKTTGKENGRVALGCVGYEILNHDMTISSMRSDPSHFRLSLKIHGIFEDPSTPIQMTVDNLIDRLNRIADVFTSKKEDTIDQDIYYTSEYNVFKLYVSNEKHTIGPLIQRYIYDLDPLIEYVGFREEHPIKNHMVLDIKHKDPKKICMNAIEAIKRDLLLFKSAF